MSNNPARHEPMIDAEIEDARQERARRCAKKFIDEIQELFGKLARSDGRGGGHVTNDVNLDDPRPPDYSGIDGESTWYYVDDGFAGTITLEAVTTGEPGDDWVLSFTATGETPEDHDRVCVRLSPTAFNELYIETKGLSTDARQAGVTTKCALCGDHVDFERAIPDGQGTPCHRRCWGDAYGAPEWFD